MDRPKLPYIDITNWAGLNTKSSTDTVEPNQLKIAENISFFDQYGGLSKLKGSSRVLATQYNEGGPSLPISWLGMYKSSDLDGAILRHVLCAAGTFIKKVSGTSLINIPNTSSNTTSTGGRTSGLAHTYDILDKFTFITNIDPDQVGVGDQMVKYDGAKISNWGLVPPGDQEIEGLGDGYSTVFSSGVQEAFDNAGTGGLPWTVVNCTLATDTTTSWDGTSLKISQTAAGSTFSLERTPATASFFVIGNGDPLADRRTEGFITDRLSTYLYIPRGSLDEFNQATVDANSNVPIAVSVYFGSNSSNYWRFDFRKGELVEGWNKLNFDFSTTPDGPMAFPTTGSRPVGRTVGAFVPSTTAVNYIKFEFVPASTSTNTFFVFLDRLATVDEGALVANALAGSSGTFSGAYQWKVSFVNKYAHSSNTGPASDSLTVSNIGGFYLSHIPVSDDKQVVARELWRTVANGTIFLRVDRIDDNTTRKYEDVIPDGSLAETTAPQAGDFSDDNSVPPKAGIAKVWKKTVFLAGDPQNPTSLYFSDDDEPESFPLLNTFELDDKITAIYETYSGLVVETETGKWQVLGDNPDFAVDKIIDGMGCVGRRAADTARLYGYAVDREGMRLFDLSDTLKISEPIRDKYDDLNKDNIEDIHTVHSKAKNAIVQFNPDSSGDYTSIFHYTYGVDDIRTGWWTNIVPPTGLNIIDSEEIEDSNGDFHVYAGTEDGMILEILTTTSKNWVKSDGTSSAVSTIFQTPYMRLGALGGDSVWVVTGKVQLTYIEVRHDGDATTWTATIDMASGPDQTTPRSTTDVPLVFGANTSLLRMPVNFGELVRDEYIRVKLTNSDLNVNSTITAIRIYFSVKEGQYPVSS